MDRDLRELKRLIRNAASSVAMDAATAGISLTRTEMQNLRFKRTPTAMDSSKPGTAQRGDRRLAMGPVSAIDYRHPGQPALDSGDNRSALEREQDSIEPDVSETDPESYDGALSSEELEQLSVSLRAPESTTRNAAGAKRVGLEEANAAYARARGVVAPVRVS